MFGLPLMNWSSNNKFMKIFALLFLIVSSSAGCQNSQFEQVAEDQKLPTAKSNSVQFEELPTPVFSIEGLAKDKRKEFDKLLSPKARIFLESSEELKIIVRRKGDLLGEGQTVDLSNNNLRMKLLNAFYVDVAESIPTGDYTHIACISPNHLIKAKSGDKKVQIEISYDCTKFYLKGDYGYSTGFIKRRNESASVKVFDQIIEKYNPDIK